MAHELWGVVPADATHFAIQVQRGKGASGKSKYANLAVTLDNGDEITWVEVAQLTRELVVDAAGSGRMRLAWERRDGSNRKSLGTSPVFGIGEAPREEPATAAAGPAALPAEPQNAWQQFLMLENLSAQRTKEHAAMLRAEADNRVKAAETSANAFVAQQQTFFQAMLEVQRQPARRDESAERQTAILEGIDRRLRALEDELEEEEEEEEHGPDAELRSVMDLYDPETGTVDWKEAAITLGPRAVEALKPLWPFVKEGLAKARADAAAAGGAPPPPKTG